MKYQELQTITSLLFSYQDVSESLGIKPDSAKNLCSRYVRQKRLIRVRRGMYILREKWQYLTEAERFSLANLIQVPSYISLITALAFFDISTQIQQNYIESIGLKRSYQKKIAEFTFTFSLIPKTAYTGFQRAEGVFIASPEKALADAVYLSSLGRYSFDLAALDMKRLDETVFSDWMKLYPRKTQKFWRAHAPA